MKGDDTRDGVRDAMEFWLFQHPISIPEIIKEAVKEAVKEWLDANPTALEASAPLKVVIE